MLPATGYEIKLSYLSGLLYPMCNNSVFSLLVYSVIDFSETSVTIYPIIGTQVNLCLLSSPLLRPLVVWVAHPPATTALLQENHLVLSHAQYVDLRGEIVGALRARLQWLRQVALSRRLVGAHLWQRGPVVRRHQQDLGLKQALLPAELPPTPWWPFTCFERIHRWHVFF